MLSAGCLRGTITFVLLSVWLSFDDFEILIVTFVTIDAPNKIDGNRLKLS